MGSLTGVRRRRTASVAVLLLCIIATPLDAAPVRARALAGLEPGLWQLRLLGPDARQPQSICVADPAQLLQVQHRDAPCSRLVLSDDPRGTTVHYTCRANGFGRTSLRVETPRLAKIDTQGIVDNAPFAYRAEARKVGSCGNTRVARRSR